jgi:hypothetical protein
MSGPDLEMEHNFSFRFSYVLVEIVHHEGLKKSIEKSIKTKVKCSCADRNECKCVAEFLKERSTTKFKSLDNVDITNLVDIARNSVFSQLMITFLLKLKSEKLTSVPIQPI